MYKELLIIRHGKATLDYDNISDIDRPLKEQGIIDVYNMANRIKDENLIPGKIITSSANRAIHTATIFAQVLNISTLDININENIYSADTEIMLNIINQIDDNIASVIIFGHNPTFTDLANYFTENYIDNLPPTGIVGLKFKTQSWSKIKRLKPVETFFDFPENSI